MYDCFFQGFIRMFVACFSIKIPETDRIKNPALGQNPGWE
jgi:hypothetical protein